MSENYRAFKKSKAYRDNFNQIDWSGVKRSQRKKRETKKRIEIIPDIEPFQTVEGRVITSRKSLREYEKKYQVRQCGNDWTGSEKPKGWDDSRVH